MKRKNFTPASRDTSASVKTIPTPRWVRKRKRTQRTTDGRWRRRSAGLDPSCPTRPHCAYRESLVDFGPVDHVPPGVDVVGTAVLILQVVRVLPDVDAEHGLLAFHQRAVLVRRAFDRELAAAVDDPRPAAAEAADARLRRTASLNVSKLPNEELIASAIAPVGAPPAFGAHDLPEHRVVRVAAAVVADRRADVFRHGVDVLKQILDALRLQIGMLLQRGIQVRHVGVVMLAVMNLHRHACRCAVRARRTRTEAAEVSEPSDVLLVGRAQRGSYLQRLRPTVALHDVYASQARLTGSLRNGEHAVERDPRPVLLVVRHDDAVVNLAGDEPFENPQQMVGRHAEHRRAEAAELIERETVRSGCTCCASRLTRWISVPTAQIDPAGLDFTCRMMYSVEPESSAACTTSNGTSG